MCIKDRSFCCDIELLISMFMIIDEKMIETEYSVTITTRNKRTIITPGQRTKIIIERKTHVLHIVENTRIF